MSSQNGQFIVQTRVYRRLRGMNRRLSNQIFLVTLGLLLSTLLIILGLHSNLIQYKVVVMDSINDPTPSDVVHLSMVVGGADATRQAVVLLKSLLYHMRWKPNIRTQNPSGKLWDCFSPSNQQARIHLHLITNKQAYVSLSPLLTTWQLPAVTFTFYRIEEYTHLVDWIPNRHYAGLFALSKILIPEILPPAIEKVVNLDVDLLFNAHIAELWNYFRRFDSKQAIGVVENQSNWYLSTSTWPAIGTGYNTGVILMHLSRLREAKWDVLWRGLMQSQLITLEHVQLADQDIFNMVLAYNPKLLYQLPCEWNLQLGINGNTSSCPIRWIQRRNYINPLSESHDVKILHFNSQLKPSFLIPNQGHDSQRPAQNKESRLRKVLEESYKYFEQLDGYLLKHELEENLHQPPCDRENMVNYIELANECMEFEIQRRMNHRIHPFYLNYQPEVDSDSHVEINRERITLVSQLSFDRLHLLEELVRRWDGPISFCLYLTDREAIIFSEFVRHSKILTKRANIGYHIVYVNGHLYPINKLRNLAIEYSSTEYVFLIDIDFIPTFNMSSRVNGLLNNLGTSSKNAMSITKSLKRCFIVPAFELRTSCGKLPNSKQDLLRLWNDGFANPFRHEIWSVGHLATNYTRWKFTREIYEVHWSVAYEPYIIFRRDVPKFDERFVGFGWNKAAHMMKLDALNYRFFVLPEEFILHLPHPSSIEVIRYRASQYYKSCVDDLKVNFIRELTNEYGIGALKYLEFRGESEDA